MNSQPRKQVKNDQPVGRVMRRRESAKISPSIPALSRDRRNWLVNLSDPLPLSKGRVGERWRGSLQELFSATTDSGLLSFRRARQCRAAASPLLYSLPSRVRKKGIPQPAPSLSSLPIGREVKESSHLSCRVANGRILPGPQESFFPQPARQGNRNLFSISSFRLARSRVAND
jgi:hypothetical protein